MAIEIRTEGGRYCPRVVCDVCAVPIGDPNSNMLWHRETPERQYFTHARCYPAFKATH
jgi:hypothetical protein